jgi:serine/threonine protein kinase
MSLPIFSNYTTIRVLGQGGMAKVYLATHNTLGHHVAIKVLDKQYAFNQNIKARFIEEAKKLVRLDHPNVVKVTDFISENEHVAYVMEYINGKSLREFLNAKRLTDTEIENYLNQMVVALNYIHKEGIIHRDIKPSNFIIATNGTLKLVDFGISKSIDTSSVDHTSTSTNLSMGTLMYMSPEQVKSTKDVTYLSDIYSLGVVLWEMVMGKVPYNSSELSAFDIQVKIVQEKLPQTNTKWDEYIQLATSKEEGQRVRFIDLLGKKHSNQTKKINDSDKNEKTLIESNYDIKSENPAKSKRKIIMIAVLILMIILTSIFIIYFQNKNQIKRNINKQAKISLSSKTNELSITESGSTILIKKNNDVLLENKIIEEKNLITINSVKTSYGTTKVISVERTRKYTIIKLRDQALGNNTWIQINPNSYIVDKQNNRRLYVVDVYGVPFAPSKRYVKYDNETIEFELFFPAVPADCNTIDFIESNGSNWKFYNLKIENVDKSDKEISAKIARGKIEQEERDEDYKREQERQERNEELKRKEEEEKKHKKIKFSNNSNVDIINLVVIFYDGKTWVTKGWYRVTSGSSFTFDLPYNYSSNSFYYYASGGGYIWTKGGDNYCVDPVNAFTYYDDKTHPCSKTESFLKKSIQGTISYINFGN